MNKLDNLDEENFNDDSNKDLFKLEMFTEEDDDAFSKQTIEKDEFKMEKIEWKNKIGGYKLSKDFFKILGLIVSGVVLALSLLTLAKSFVPAQKTDSLLLSYNVSGSADYRVNLIKNDFYETPTLGKGQLVPVTFIDDIVVDFSQYLSANKQININYTYKVTGELIASASDNGKENSGGKIWTKNYTFVPSKSLTQPTATGYNINEKVVIDYNTYNELVNKYKLLASVPMNAVLKVTLTVTANSNIEGKALNESNSVSVDIPLSVSTVMIKANSIETKTNMLVDTKEIPASTNYVLLVISIIMLIGSLIVTIYLLKGLRKMTEDHSLLLKFNKIMRDYSQVVIEIEELPEVKGAAVIEVKSFRDMLDIEKELRLPILCCKSKDEVLTNNMFYIVNQNQIFKYRLSADLERI